MILDQSGSMSEKLGEDTRMEVAKRVSLKLIEKFPSTAAGLGFYSYGTKLPEGEEQGGEDNGCRSFTELQSPFQKLNRKELKEHIQKMQPELGTPLAYSLLKFRESILDKKGKLIDKELRSDFSNPASQRLPHIVANSKLSFWSYLKAKLGKSISLELDSIYLIAMDSL
jgi:hypothetical protein